jgi:hypothetical protein
MPIFRFYRSNLRQRTQILKRFQLIFTQILPHPKKIEKKRIFGLHFASTGCILILLRESGGKKSPPKKFLFFSLTGSLEKVKFPVES